MALETKWGLVVMVGLYAPWTLEFAMFSRCVRTYWASWIVTSWPPASCSADAGCQSIDFGVVDLPKHSNRYVEIANLEQLSDFCDVQVHIMVGIDLFDQHDNVPKCCNVFIVP